MFAEEPKAGSGWDEHDDQARKGYKERKADSVKDREGIVEKGSEEGRHVERRGLGLPLTGDGGVVNSGRVGSGSEMREMLTRWRPNSPAGRSLTSARCVTDREEGDELKLLRRDDSRWRGQLTMSS